MSQLALALPTPITPSRPQRVALVSAEQDAQAQERFAILETILAYKAEPLRYGMLRLKDGTPVTSHTRMVEYTSEVSGVSRSQLYRWLSAFSEGGKPALVDRLRRDKGSSRFFRTYPKAAWLACYLFFGDPDAPEAQRRFMGQSSRFCFEAILRDLDMLGIPAEDAPCYDTVRAYLASMPPSLTVYARLGKKAYRERMAPYLRSQFTDLYANQVWVGDHMIHDVEVMNDCFDNVEWGAPIRIRFSVMMDRRSRLFVGGSWCWEGSSRAIAACMRRAILKYGPPEHIYVDNGKDYRKVARGALPGYLVESPLAPVDWWRAELDSIAATGFLARLGIAVTHCLPHHPQSKNVERAFRTVHERFDKAWPTYTSGDPFTRPDSTELAMMQHRRLIKAGRVEDSKHPLASKFILACLAWLEEYSDTPQTGQGMDGGTPRQVFEANLNPNQKPAPEPAALTLLMAEREKRGVHECKVRHANRFYEAADETGWAVMHAFNERDVLIVFDPVDLSNIAAVDEDGNFLAWLQPEQLTRFAPYDKRTQLQIADSMATRRRLEKGNRQVLEVISHAARQNGGLSPLESLVKRLELPAGETGADLITQRKPRFAPDNDEPQNLIPGEAADRMIASLKRSKTSGTPQNQ